jgi:hypothetical protein
MVQNGNSLQGGPGYEQQVVRRKKDPFKSQAVKEGHVYGQNWSYDYVMVFEVKTEETAVEQEGNTEEDIFKRNHTLERIVSRLSNGGLETKMFYSQDRSLIFLKVRADLERLCEHADFIDYPLRMEDSYVREKLARGEPNDEGGFTWRPKQYSDALNAKAEDDTWAADNYIRGESKADTFEYMIIRDDSKESALLPESEKKVVAKVFPIRDDLQQCQYKYYQYHYGKYDDKYAFDGPKGMYTVDLRSSSPFRNVDRLKLIAGPGGILETPVKDKGCGLDVKKLIIKDCMVAAFALHDEDMVIELQSQWLVRWKMPWELDNGIEKIRNYFGEKVALYFKFVTVYTTYLRYAAILGVFSFFWICVETTGFYGLAKGSPGSEFGTYRTHGSSIFVLPCALIMCVWTTAFLEAFKKEQVTCAMKWGMVGYEDQELPPRPEFRANTVDNVLINNPINGREQLYFPEEEAARRLKISYAIIAVIIFFVILGVMIVFFVKALVDPNQCIKKIVEDDPPDGYDDFVKGQPYGKPTMLCIKTPILQYVAIPPMFGIIPEIPLGAAIAGIVNAVNIIIFDAIYTPLSKKLNLWENHRTDIEYEDELINKTFVFAMVNSFGALTYIAFIKEPVVNRLPGMDIYAMCPFEFKEAGRGRSCFSELAAQLFSIFVVKVIVDNLNLIVLPYLKSSMMKKEESEEDDELDDPDAEGGMPPTKRMKSLVEKEYDLMEYDVLEGTFDDYKEMVFQFGYATIFFTAFPIAPLMAFLANYMQIRYDLYKICQLSRRVMPTSNEDIGSWENIVNVIGTIAVVSNCALIVFTSGYLKDYQRQDGEIGSFPSFNSSPSEGQHASRSVQGYKWLLFFLLEHFLIIAKALYDALSPDIPGDVEIQIARQELVVSKLIANEESEPEDSDDSDDPLDGVPDKTIWQTDDDIVLKEHAEEEYLRKRRHMRAQGLGGEGDGAVEESKEPEKAV